MKSALCAIVAASIVAYATPSFAADTCVFLMGEVNGGTVATPAVMIITPTVNAIVTPAQVVVDGTNQDIVGYKLSTPGQTVDTPGYSVYVPAEEVGASSYSATLDDLAIGQHRCINRGVSTPAVPIYIPPSHLETPGVLTTTPGATITIAHQQVTVPAHIVEIPGHSILVPGADDTIEPVTVETPEESIEIEFLVPWVVPYLAPVSVDTNDPPAP